MNCQIHLGVQEASVVQENKMKEEIIKKIEEFLKERGVENPKVALTPSVYLEKGDYSTNVAMVYAKQLGVKPLELAGEIKNKLGEIAIVAVPGFINFSFDKEYFGNVVKEIISNGNQFGKSEHAKEFKIFIEHTQPNPFKEFHIGHLMNNAIGESVTRIVKAHGAETKVASYHGDVGLHVAKAVWGILKEPDNFMSAYARGHKAYEEDEAAKQEINEINKKIYDKSDEEINKIYDDGREKSLSFFDEIYKKLDSHFDYHFYESQSGEMGKQLVEENIPKVFEESEGAVIFRGENFEPKTHTRVFLNKDRLPTYEAKEVGLAKMKKDSWSYDASITITANEQDSFFNVVEVAIGEVFPDLKGKLKHLSHGLLKLPSGKMSSRTGTIISAESLINQVKEKVIDKIKNPSLPEYSEKLVKGYSEKELEDISEIVSIGAIKYSVLHQAIGGDIVFDFDKSISFEGDSGPYLQYSAVRAQSLLKKAEGVVSVSKNLPENWETTNLERLLERFPEVLARAGQEYAPHFIATYLIELAGEFNSFYAHHKIIDEGDITSPYRLALTQAFHQVMLSGLDLLGIKVPEKM